MNDEQRLAVGEPLVAAHFRLGILLRAFTSASTLEPAIAARKVAEIVGLLQLALEKLGIDPPAALKFDFSDPADDETKELTSPEKPA